MDRTSVLRSQAHWSQGVVMLVGALVMALLASACASGASGNPVPGTFSGADSPEGRAMASGQSYGIYPPAGGTGIHATGVGAVKVRPDLAVLTLGVEGFAPTVAEARNIAAEAMQGVMDHLRASGVREEDIQTQFFNIQPQYTWEEVVRDGRRHGEQRLIGYRVTNTLTVKVRNLDNVGPIIDGAVQAGGDATRVQNIYFTVENGQEAEHQARVLALQDARAKADVYARELGVSRGRLAYVAEVSFTPYPRMDSRMAFDGAPAEAMPMPETPITPGEFEVRVTVQTVFDIN